MVKKIFGCLIVILITTGFSLTQEPVGINIKIPVRVFDGNQFVDNLTIDDFEIYENDIRRNINALVLTEKAQIVRQDLKQQVKPNLSRHFCFLFQITDYNPRISEGMTYFFDNIFQPGDSIMLITPLKQYSLSSKALEIKSREDLVKDIINVIRRDTLSGSAEYNSAITDLRRIVSSISSASGGQQTVYQTSIDTTQSTSYTNPLDQLLPNYRETLEKLENMRIVNEESFLSFASHFKSLPGQRIAFLFYQREFRPELDSTTMNRLISNNQDNQALLNQIQDLFQVYYRDVNMNVDRMKQVFADASVMINLLFFNKTPEQIPGVYMREQSEDLYQIFSELAQSTGGIVNSAQNPAAALKQVSDTADKCYILYYSSPMSDIQSRFKNVKVVVKGAKYRVLHRQGYFQLEIK